MAIANFQTLSLVGLLHSHTCSEWWAVWILCLWLPSHLLPSAGCFCNCSTLNQWVICDQWVKQLRIQLRCCNRMKPLQQVLFDVPRSAGCDVTAKVKHSSSVFRCQTTKRHRSTALQTFYRFLKVSLPPNLTFKLFLTTTPQLLIYSVLHYLTFLISADVHEVNFFHCYGCRSVNMYTSPSHCCTGPISNDDKGCCRCVWCFHVCVISLWWSQFIVAISHWAVILGCHRYSHH